MQFQDIVMREEGGLVMAGFLCSADAHRYAKDNATPNYPLLVRDYADMVTRHEWEKPPVVIELGRGERGALANLMAWHPGTTVAAETQEA